MEHSLEWKKKKYTQACNILRAHNTKANYCGIKQLKTKITCKGEFKRDKQLCCHRCSHLTANGCGTNSLACLISFCYIETGPLSCGLCKTKAEKLNAGRRLKIVILIENFFKKYDIPLYWKRMSMEDAFKIYLKEKDINDFDFYSATFKK